MKISEYFSQPRSVYCTEADGDKQLRRAGTATQMSGAQGVKRATDSDFSSASSSSSSHVSRSVHDCGAGSGSGSGGGTGGGGGGAGLCGITAVGKVFHFLEGPAHVLSASTVCRRWHELACADSVWRVKVEREGISDKAKAFEVEAPPPAQEGALLEDEGTASMAFYARVFVLKVV